MGPGWFIMANVTVVDKKNYTAYQYLNLSNMVATFQPSKATKVQLDRDRYLGELLVSHVYCHHFQSSKYQEVGSHLDHVGSHRGPRLTGTGGPNGSKVQVMIACGAASPARSLLYS